MLIERETDNFYNLKWLDTFMVGHKGFIAGGCFKNIFNGEKAKDLDIFFENENDWKDAVEFFDEECGEENQDGLFRFYYENDKVKAYKHIKSDITLELIRKTYGTARDIIDNFDFTIVKFAYYKVQVEDEFVFDESSPFESKSEPIIPSTHIEYKIIHDDKFFEHLHQKRLVVDNKIPFPISTFERMLRYAKYGYYPCKDTKMRIIQGIRDVEKVDGLSDSLYDGVD